MKEIYRLQVEYIDKLKKFVEKDINTRSIEEIIYFIDDIEMLWRRNRRLIQHFIEINKGKLIVHCGSIYLDVSNNENISYNVINKSLVIDEPIVKMSVIFRGYKHINYNDMCNRLKQTITKILEVYKLPYNNNIFILPINFIYSATNIDKETFCNIISNATINYINSKLNTSYNSLDEWRNEKNDLEKFISKYRC